MPGATLDCEGGADLSQSLSNGISPSGRESINSRDVVSGRLIPLQQQGSIVPSPRGTADPFSNIPPQCRDFYKGKETHLVLCVSSSSVAGG